MKIFKTLLTSALSFACASELLAQVAVQNTGIMYVTGSPDILYINGAFTNAAGSALTNNGNLYVTGNVANNQASMSIGTGTLYLNGTALQTVTGSQAFRTFNLVTNNTAGLLLNNNLSVTGSHTFTAGIISTSATPNYLVYEAGSSYSGDGDTRHVNGWVTRSGATAFAFPLGNGAVERKIALANISALSIFNASYQGATNNTTNIASPLTVVDPNEYWTLNRISGGNANVILNWDNSKVAMPNYGIADIRVANYISGNWTNAGGTATGATATIGTITSNVLSSFGSFSIGSVSFVLPAQLISFSAGKANNNVLLKWSTTDENNVNYYEPQRSEDGVVFSGLGKTTARNTAGRNSYESYDTKVLAAITYYRLRSVDLDGKSTLSKTITISNNEATGIDLSMVNPVRKRIIAFTKNMDGVYQYGINTISGQSVQHGYVTIGSAGLDILLSETVNKGVYFLQLQKPGVNVVRKIIVE
jgi:hypothetical protein